MCWLEGEAGGNEWIDASRHPLCRFESCFSLSFVHIHLYCSEIMDLRRACLNKNVLHGLPESPYKTAVLNCAKGCVEIFCLVLAVLFYDFFFFNTL